MTNRSTLNAVSQKIDFQQAVESLLKSFEQSSAERSKSLCRGAFIVACLGLPGAFGIEDSVDLLQYQKDLGLAFDSRWDKTQTLCSTKGGLQP